MKAVLSVIILLGSISLSAMTIFECKEDSSTMIGWEYKKDGTGYMKPEASMPKRPVELVFVEEKNKATLKGNIAQVTLSKIGPDSFTEKTGGGLWMWTILRGNKKYPTYIIQQKAYNIAGPLVVSVAYRCK